VQKLNASAKKGSPFARFLSVDVVNEHKRLLVGFRAPQTAEPQTREPEPPTAAPSGARDKRWGLRLPSLLDRATLGKASREERSDERDRARRLASAEAAKQVFFETPAGKARLAYKRGHRLFQYELEINGLPPTVVPGPVGSPARETTDPVDILNSVTVEGWKLVTGKFVHSEIRNGVIGCYLFKRSQKRRLSMNNPWQDPGITS
jgi:hypothetical protein